MVPTNTSVWKHGKCSTEDARGETRPLCPKRDLCIDSELMNILDILEAARATANERKTSINTTLSRSTRDADRRTDRQTDKSAITKTETGGGDHLLLASVI